MAEILSDRPALAWVEVHPENYLRNHPARAALVEEFVMMYPSC